MNKSSLLLGAACMAAASAVDYLMKPLDPARLTRAVLHLRAGHKYVAVVTADKRR